MRSIDAGKAAEPTRNRCHLSAQLNASLPYTIAARSSGTNDCVDGRVASHRTGLRRCSRRTIWGCHGCPSRSVLYPPVICMGGGAQSLSHTCDGRCHLYTVWRSFLCHVCGSPFSVMCMGNCVVSACDLSGRRYCLSCVHVTLQVNLCVA